MNDLVTQLRKNASRNLGDGPEARGVTTYFFPWSAGFNVRSMPSSHELRRVCTRSPKKVLARCPIYRRLDSQGRKEVILRGPKSLLRYRSYVWTLFQTALDGYESFQPGGVSPVTAMALLLPEPRLERRFGGLSDLLVVPDPVSYRGSGAGASRRHRIAEWHVVIWALKRYTTMSWSNIAGLSSDLKRGATSFRQTIRFSVEGPLAGFYRHLTGEVLPPDTYQAAMQDRPNSPPWSREKMRELKRSAHARHGNPTKQGTPSL
jgi:hypothetical protein